MNIRKVLLLTLILSIASFGLTLTGCEKSDHPTAEHPSTEAVEEAAAEEVVEEVVEEAEDVAETCCGEDPSKCCASKAAD
ncbi:MAG: hypothetical protein ACYSO2_09455, partial [Planctomycetota bacterium]